MPSKEKLQKEAWKNYGAWQTKAQNEYDISMSYARAKMAASGIQITPGMLEAAQTPVQEAFDEQMEVYKDTEAYKILKKNYKTQRSRAQSEFTRQDLEITQRQKDMYSAEATLNAAPEGSQRVKAETDYNTAKALYEEGVAFKDENKETRGVYGSLETYYTAMYDDKADMGIMTLSGELLSSKESKPKPMGEGRDDPYEPWASNQAVAPTYEPTMADYDRPR